MAKNLLIMFGGTAEGDHPFTPPNISPVQETEFQTVFDNGTLDAAQTDVLQFNFLTSNPEVTFREAGGGDFKYWLRTLSLPTQRIDVGIAGSGFVEVNNKLFDTETTLEGLNWSALTGSPSSASGMTLNQHNQYVDRAKEIAYAYLDSVAPDYGNIFVTGHSRGASLAASFAGTLEENAEMKTALKRLVLQDPVSKNKDRIDDEDIIKRAMESVARLTQTDKEVHIIARGRDSNVGTLGGGSLREYETYGSELMGGAYFYFGGKDRLEEGSPTSKISQYPISAANRHRLNVGNLHWHLADMQHGYMMQGIPIEAKDKNGNNYLNFRQGFAEANRIIDPNPWTEVIHNNKVINIDEMAKSPHLNSYIRNEGPVVANKSRSQWTKFKDGSYHNFDFPALPTSDPLHSIYNEISTPIVGATALTKDSWAARRAALVHSLAYKVMAPTIELSASATSVKEPLAGGTRQITLTVTSNRVYNTPQEVNIGIKPGVANAATLNEDYTLSDGLKIVIPANQKTGRATFNVLADSKYEPTETAAFQIERVVNRTPYGVDTGDGIGIVGFAKEDKKEIAIEIEDNTIPGLVIEQFPALAEVEEGNPDKFFEYRVKLAAPPTDDAVVTVTAPDDQVILAPGSLTFTTGNWDTVQTIKVTAKDDGDIEALNHTGQVKFDVASADANYNGKTETKTVRIIDNDSATAVLVESDNSTQVFEGDGVFAFIEGGPTSETDTYTIALNGAPVDGEIVTIQFTPDEQLAPIASITFTKDDWNQPKTISVKPNNDRDIEDGFHTGIIKHQVTSNQTGSDFNNLKIRDVAVNIQDDDPASITIQPDDGSVKASESGTPGTYTIVLDSKPRGKVQIGFFTDTQIEALDPIEFTPDNWNIPKTITVRAVDDQDFEEPIHTSLIEYIVTSEDELYDQRYFTTEIKIEENDFLNPPVTETDASSGGTTPSGTPGLSVTDPSSNAAVPSIPDGTITPIVFSAETTQSDERVLRVNNPGTEALVFTDLLFRAELNSFPPGLTANDIFEFSLSRNPVPAGAAANLTVRLRDDLPPGDYRGSFVGMTNLPSPDAAYNFPVEATVSLPLAADVANAGGIPPMDPEPETAGDDEIFGHALGDGPQWLNGSYGNDLINGNEGTDVITGGPGNDTLHGGTGDDFVKGAAGDDLLFGDLGNDILIGNEGSDQFVLGLGDGSDLILDFQSDRDSFRLKPNLTRDALTFKSAGNSTQILASDELLATVVGVPTAIVSGATFAPLS